MALTKTEKAQDLKMALDILRNHKNDITQSGALVLISQELGKGVTDYLRVTLAYRREHQINQAHLTWAIAKALGFSLRDRQGYWFIAISGGGFSKPDEIARALASFYRVERVRYEIA
jgi:cobalamin biosynthesis protein CobD/CbiB